VGRGIKGIKIEGTWGPVANRINKKEILRLMEPSTTGVIGALGGYRRLDEIPREGMIGYIRKG
jgi:hypothetical protein